MNKKQVKFFIRQAIDQLETQIRDIDESETADDLVLASNLTTSLNYLFAAWSFRNISSDELNHVSQEQYETIIFNFPTDIDPRFNRVDEQ